jgi:hypothetical protein
MGPDARKNELLEGSVQRGNALELRRTESA